jgi:O-antigen/teichoic acid export membrane protein
MMVQTARLNRQMRFKESGLAMAAGSASATITTTLAAWLGLGTASLIIGWPVNILVQKLVIHKFIGPPPTPGTWNWVLASQAMKLQLSQLTGTAIPNTPSIIGGLFILPSVLGAYQWATAITLQTVFLVSNNLQTVYLSDFSKCFDEGTLAYRWRRNLYRSLLIGLVIALMQALLLPPVLSVILPNAWSGIESMIRWACLSALLLPAGTVARACLSALNKPSIILLADLTSLTVCVISLTIVTIHYPNLYPTTAAISLLFSSFTLILLADRTVRGT